MVKLDEVCACSTLLSLTQRREVSPQSWIKVMLKELRCAESARRCGEGTSVKHESVSLSPQHLSNIEGA